VRCFATLSKSPPAVPVEFVTKLPPTVTESGRRLDKSITPLFLPVFPVNSTPFFPEFGGM